MLSGEALEICAIVVCTGAPILGLSFACLYAWQTKQIIIAPSLMENIDEKNIQVLNEMYKIFNLIYDGAHSFLYAEYRYISVFVGLFTVVIIVVLGATESWINAAFTAIAFLVGCATSVLCGLIGMKIAVFSNARVTLSAQESLECAFRTSFKAAVVMGFFLTSVALLTLFVLIYIYMTYYRDAFQDEMTTIALFEAIAGYGLGGSCIGLFGRVGGGIYTKAADVGADLVGKNFADLPEDDPRNPAVIADNVGDNVGDIAGMGADLFGSFAEATCAALVIGSRGTLGENWYHSCFPIIISATGIIACFFTSFIASHVCKVDNDEKVERTLKMQLLISTLFMTPVLFGISWMFLPEISVIAGVKDIKNWYICVCALCGLWSGLIIGYITEYYTSHSYRPVQQVAQACAEGGAATNIIYGLALGYISVIIPVVCLAITCYVSHTLAGFYGIAIAAIGILSTLSICLTIDAFGPICDNAGGIAEMSGFDEEVRDRTDALDAAGNTTAAIGKGFAIGSAALVSLALFSGFVTMAADGFMTTGGGLVVNILEPWAFSGLLIGAMLPYWFTAMTMKSVGIAASAIVLEVQRQWRENPRILIDNGDEPDYAKCIEISTEASLREMFAPGALVMLSPLIMGFCFGVQALAGMLAGALVSGVQMAISQSNTGGAWDNAKKYIEAGNLMYTDEHGNVVPYLKKSATHKASVVGDTVGDPLKDTSGPSINILIKLMAIISLVFGRSFPTNEGGYLGRLFDML